ncbi:MAG: chorismate synthase, partial [Thermomicrobiales bacterium]
VEIGSGFAVARERGSQSNDAFLIENGNVRARSNNAGGTLGGISTGEEIIVRVAMKPTSSIEQEQDTIDTDLQPQKLTVYGRHDPSIVPRAVPVIESMLAIVLADLYLLNRSARIAWPD